MRVIALEKGGAGSVDRRLPLVAMPVIKPQNISTFSSEDSNHPARNLLSSDTYRKWKCATGGEKQAVVVFELRTPVQIRSVDIGNEGSAFVEVLVARSSAADDYKVLLMASSFMTPSDSKTWRNTNRVRMFGPDKLSKGVVEQKWDRVKIVCTQPYNKKEQYGLSFLTLHSPPDDSSGTGDEEKTTPKTTPTKPKLGAFSLKEEPKALPTGSLFYKKEGSSSQGSGVSAAAQARSATAAALQNSPSPSPAPIREKRRREGHGRREEEGEKDGKKKPAGEQNKTKALSARDSRGPMSGVVFSLSGFKNPFRTELREKMVEMGASFTPDWNSSCTHLICAFPNTPKFNQVKEGRGLIVTKQWVMDSYVKKKRLPASKYRLSGGGDSSSEEEQVYDKRERDLFGAKASDASGGRVSEEGVGVAGGDRKAKAVVGEKRSRDQLANEEQEDPYGRSTDEEMESDVAVKSKPAAPGSQQSSECDTEDEIQRIKAEQEEYAGTTETDTDTTGWCYISSPASTLCIHVHTCIIIAI
ncbi:DNA repair protein XRCC1 [Geodia barretti]|uniref:DNA repair protein XRCC1 n=1 Tax=Geodia barretti TaxID=519541 RepID=A0AA35S7Y0_GEOBA|nr:DNA repair protein XRCC1 [Geodia barretti]